MPKHDDYEDEMFPLSETAEKNLSRRIENINSTTITSNNVSASIAATAQAAAITASSGAESEIVNTNTDWINNKWRPAMGWMYMCLCMFDFMIAPILWSIIQALGNGGKVELQWQPLTLQGAGLFHVAMGAVLGISAYGRTKEKVADKA
jgi:hypothetical protein